MAESFLKEGVSFDDLDFKANMMSDGEAARQMHLALKKLFQVMFNGKEQIKLVNATDNTC